VVEAQEQQKPEVVLSILVISYECREMTLRALETTFAETRTPMEVICVDNASEDGSAAAIAEKFPQVQLIALETNIGFAAANNLAAQHARGKRLLLLNPDTEIMDGAVDRLYEFAEQTPNAGIWGGRTLFGDGTLNIGSCWNFMTLWSLFCRASGLTWMFPGSELFNSETIGAWKRDSEREVGIVTGCFLLIDRALWDQLEGFNPDFFMYGEEADLCYRAAQVGARPRITPRATIVHHGGQSEVSSANKLIKVTKGKVTWMNAHWTASRRLIGKVLFLVMVGLRALASFLIQPTIDRSGGLDDQTGMWRVAFARRAEWLDGWPLKSARRAR
jgi:GT2 family glycosyltransferase